MKKSPSLLYEGSVKNLWQVSPELDDGVIEFEYTDAYSVFDWGRMPDQLAFKGESLAAMGAYFFEAAADVKTWRGLGLAKRFASLETRLKECITRELSVLEREGLKSHFVKRSAANRLLVKRVQAFAPEKQQLAGQTLYHYKNNFQGASERSRLIPLEVVFRFGAPHGSSLFERLTPAYAAQLGFKSIPKANEKFQTPIIEFFSKLEDTDRFLSWEQALNYSGIEYKIFERLVARSLCVAVWLQEIFAQKGLELWDGKFEWAMLDGELALVDSIGPDELRLLDPHSGAQISKEFLRAFYRKTPWFEAIKDAKTQSATQPGLDWKALVRNQVGEAPALNAEYRATADVLYPSLAFALTGQNPGGSAVALEQIFERIRQCQRL